MNDIISNVYLLSFKYEEMDMCKETKQYIIITYDNTEKSREMALKLAQGIEEEGALYLIQEEKKLPHIQMEANESDNKDEVNDIEEHMVSISVGIKDEEISVYYKKSQDIPLIKYDVVVSNNEDSEEKDEENDINFKTIGKNVAQLIKFKSFINGLDN